MSTRHRSVAVLVALAARRSARPALALLATVTLLALAIASASAAPDPHQPSLAAMAIAGTDLSHGAKVRRQGYGRESGFILYYKRAFRRGASFRRARFLELEADVGLAADPGKASNFVSGLERAFKSKRFRGQLVRALAGAHRGVKVSFGRVSNMAIGDGAFIAPFSISIGGLLRFPFAIAAVRVDRADQMLLMLGMPGSKLARADVAALLGLAAAHMTTGLTPTLVGAPTIGGTPQSGQTLTASPGLWTNAPSSYAYQWLRCDSTGANCQPIVDAVAPTYVVTDADIGSTLRVEVTATDAVAASVPAQSEATAVVTAAPAMGTSADREHGLSR
jgi:hypothetical protein